MITTDRVPGGFKNSCSSAYEEILLKNRKLHAAPKVFNVSKII